MVLVPPIKSLVTLSSKALGHANHFFRESSTSRIGSAYNTLDQAPAFFQTSSLGPVIADPTVPQWAFAGRSNSGKSSVLNALLGKRARVVFVSKTPGRTRNLDFVGIQDPPKALLVDMPGYGYSKASKSQVKTWNRFLPIYLATLSSTHSHTPLPHAVCVMIDSRRGLMDVDKVFLDLLAEHEVGFLLCCTKSDHRKITSIPSITSDYDLVIGKHGPPSLKAQALAASLHLYCNSHYPNYLNQVIVTSAKTGMGIDVLGHALMARMKH